MDLSESLKDWTDFDLAEFAIGQKLGIFNEWKAEHKGILWSSHPVGEYLAEVLQGLVDLGYVEKDGDGAKFRWVQSASITPDPKILTV